MIIGLSGRAQAGKSTVADYLVRQHGFTPFAFADTLKAALLDLNPLVWTEYGSETRLQDVVRMEGWDRAKQDYEVRGLLQRFGTEVGRRHFGEDFWVDQVFRHIGRNQDAVISDVRFPNEAAAVRNVANNTGLLVRVERPGLPVLPGAHASEHALDDYAFGATIYNRGTIDDLEAGIDGLIYER